jgi:hypothetical protein
MTGKFNKLSLVQQYILLCNKGKFVGTIRVDKRKINLYLMDNRYYELRYDEAGNLIEKIQQLTTLNFYKRYSLTN